MEHEIPFGNSNRENGTTFLDFPLFLGIFQWDEPTKRVPFTAEPEIPEILSKWKAPQIVGVGSRSGRISQSECTFPRFVIGLVLLLLLPTPTIWFSLDHKRNVSDGVVSGIETLFSLDHKLYASDYDSDFDSVASENQP